MQGHKFVHGVHVLDLEPYDLILGVDWMKSYSPMTFDFRELKLTFVKEGQRILLQGRFNCSNVAYKQGMATEKFIQKKWGRILQQVCMLKVSHP